MAHQTYMTVAEGYEGYDRVLNATPYDQLTSAQLHELAEHFGQLHQRREGEINARAVTTSEAQRVAAGMAWLDEHYPDHVERFDHETFHIMGYPLWPHDSNNDKVIYRDCALVKAAGMDWAAVTMRYSGITDADWTMMGFNVPSLSGEAYEDQKSRTERLNQAWLAAYFQRKAAS